MKIIERQTYKIVVEDFNNPIIYNGSQLSSQFTANNYDIIGNSILIFRGGMKLSPDEMIDIKDILRESHLNEILISSDDSIHFIIEEFDTQPPNLEIEYYRLRILIQIVIENLKEEGLETKRIGTDIYIEGKKLNVGIATIGASSGKIHFGINVGNTGFPSHVDALGLLEIGMQENQIKDWIVKIAEQYIEEIHKVKEDIVKTRSI